MRKIHIVVWFLASLVCGNALLAAPPELLPQNGFRIGLAHTGLTTGKSTAKTGFMASSFITWNIYKNIHIQTELEFTVKKTDAVRKYLKGKIISQLTTRTLSLPITLLIPVLGSQNSKISVFTGLSSGLNLGNVQKHTYIADDPEGFELEDSEFSVPALDGVLGMDFRYKKSDFGFIFDTRLTLGLLNFVDQEKRFTLQISLGYSFNL